jgi:hypothetical protein
MSEENRIASPTSNLCWGTDKLSEFLQRVRDHQLATFINIRPAFDVLREIDDCFVRISESMEKSQTSQLSLMFFDRCHAAYRATCGTSMAGQSPETFVLLRSCLEYSGYALLIHQKPHLEMVWLHRHNGDDARSKMRNAFTATKAKKGVQSTDPGLGHWYNDLYDNAIDFGAHPNAKGVTASMRFDEGSYRQIDLHDDDLVLHHCLDSTARAGLCSLYVFYDILPERFIRLGISKKVDELRLTKHL